MKLSDLGDIQVLIEFEYGLFHGYGHRSISLSARQPRATARLNNPRRGHADAPQRATLRLYCLDQLQIRREIGLGTATACAHSRTSQRIGAARRQGLGLTADTPESLLESNYHSGDLSSRSPDSLAVLSCIQRRVPWGTVPALDFWRHSDPLSHKAIGVPAPEIGLPTLLVFIPQDALGILIRFALLAPVGRAPLFLAIARHHLVEGRGTRAGIGPAPTHLLIFLI